MPLTVLARPLEEQKHAEDVEVIIYHNGKLFSGADDGKVKVWSSDLKLEHEFEAHYNMVYHMVIEDSRLYTCSNDSTIKIWNMETWELQQILLGHENAVRKLCFSEGKLYSGDDNGELRVWDKGRLECVYPVIEEVWDMAIRGNLVYTVRDKDVSVTQLISSVKNRYCTRSSMIGRSPLCIIEDKLCFCSREGTELYVHSNDYKTFPQLKVLKGHSRIINAIAGANTTLYSGGWDNTVRAWNLHNFECISTIDLTNYITAMCVGAPGEVYVGGMEGFMCKLKLT